MNGLVARAGIRTRIVTVATFVFVIALAMSALVVRARLHSSVTQALRSEALTRADDVAELVETGAWAKIISSEGQAQAWIQVVDRSGNVLGSSYSVRHIRRSFVPPSPRRSTRVVSDLTINDGQAVIVASVPVTAYAAAADRQPPAAIITAIPIQLADTAGTKAIESMLRVFPVLLVLLAIGTWEVVGRALRPVEHIRTEVAAITSTDLHRSVPVPAANDEIGRLARTMNDMLRRLRDSSDRQREFVADASHELRSPLASLRSQLEVSVLDNPDPAWHATVAEMLEDHDRLERLLRDLLLLARHDEGERFVTEPVDLGWLVRDKVRRRPPVAGLVRTVDVETSFVDGSPDALLRVLRNLLDNAERHAAHEVRVQVHTIENLVRIVVSDDGPGIPPDKHSLVFERFTRLDNHRAEDSGGSGLGLAIVRELVEAHGGTVTVEQTSWSSSGAAFVVFLPRSDDVTGAMESETSV